MSMFYIADTEQSDTHPGKDQYDEDLRVWQKTELNRRAILSRHPDYVEEDTAG